MHSFELVEDGFETPEAAARQGRGGKAGRAGIEVGSSGVEIGGAHAPSVGRGRCQAQSRRNSTNKRTPYPVAPGVR